MENKRPYWKVAVSLAASLIATSIVIVAGVKLLSFFLPFVIGWLIALLAYRPVCWLETRLKMKKKFGSALIVAGVLAAIVLLLYWGISKLAVEVGRFAQDVPAIYQDLEMGLRQIGNDLAGLYERLPEGIQNGWQSMVENLDSYMGTLISAISEPTVEAAGNLAKRIPSMLVTVIVTIMSAYFFIVDRDEVLQWLIRVSPESIRKRMAMVSHNFRYAIGGYFRAQLKIMAVVGVIVFFGLTIMGVNYTILLAILIALVDMLPFFGTGTILIPWIIYKFMVGGYKMAAGLLILYIVTQVVRQVIQPKLVGDSMGLNPIVTLVLLYIGYKVGSVVGLLLAVPIGMIVINMVKAGAFDYIIDDVKILAEGILSLRE